MTNFLLRPGQVPRSSHPSYGADFTTHFSQRMIVMPIARTNADTELWLTIISVAAVSAHRLRILIKRSIGRAVYS